MQIYTVEAILLVFLILRFVYPLSRQRVAELQQQKEQMFRDQAAKA